MGGKGSPAVAVVAAEMQLANYRCPFPARRVGSNARVERDATVTVWLFPASSESVREEAGKFKTAFSSKTLQLKCLYRDSSFAFVCIIDAAQTIFPV